jgi:putative flippase GtrA
LGRGWPQKIAKSASGSVVATVAGQLTFLTVYGLGLAGTRGSTIMAFLAGVLPNYWFNRHWAWRRSGRPRLLRELLPYVATILLNLVLALTATSVAEARVEDATDSHIWRVAVVTVTYAATYGLLFLAKYLVFEHLLFGERSPAQRRGARRTRKADVDTAPEGAGMRDPT